MVEVESGSNAAGSLFKTKGGSVDSTVWFNEGGPGELLRVGAYLKSTGFGSPRLLASAQTDDRGQFRIAGLAPGRYLNRS